MDIAYSGSVNKRGRPKKTALSQESYFQNPLSKVTASYLYTKQMTYQISDFSQSLRNKISHFLSSKGSLSFQFSGNLQSVLERAAQAMVVSEIEFLCFCINFENFSEKVSDFSFAELVHMIFFVVKSRLESDFALIEAIQEYLKVFYPRALYKAQSFKGFTADIFRLNKAFSEYTIQRVFKLNYANYVDDIFKYSLPYKRKQKIRKPERDYIKKCKDSHDILQYENIAPVLIEKSLDRINTASSEEEQYSMFDFQEIDDGYYNIHDFDPIN